MNYKKIYDSLIESRKVLNRERSKIIYYEKHHILPTSLGGTNDKNNLVLLTAKEHFIAHLLLTQFTIGKDRSKMIYALWRLSIGKSSKRKPNYSSRQYEIAKLLHKEALKTRVFSESQREKMRESQKLRWFKISEEEREKFGNKIKQSKTGVVSKLKNRTYLDIYGENSFEQSEKRKFLIKGKSYEQIYGEEKAREQKNKLKEAHSGKKQSIDTINKRKVSLLKSWEKRKKDNYEK